MKITIKKLLNPLYVIILQYIIIIYLTITNYEKPSIKLCAYLYIPLILYFVVYINIKYISITKKKTEISIITFKTIFCFIIIFTLIEIKSIIYLFSIKSLFSHSNELMWYIQSNNIIELKYSLFILNIAPIFNVFLYAYIKNIKNNKVHKFILLMFNISIFIESFIVGTRILFLFAILPIIFIRYMDMHMKFKRLSYIFIVLILCFFTLVWGQSLKTQNKSFRYNSNYVMSYYTQSLNNCFYIVDTYDKGFNPYYWTIYRQLSSIPIINTYSKDIYMNIHGILPINSREDDFKYVENLNLPRAFNTFSIWGYSYLDFGVFGVIPVFISFVITQILYFKLDKSFIRRIIYPIFYLSLLDQIRTNGIYSYKIVFAMLTLLGILILNKIFIKIFHKANKYNIT
ncbi:O-antigen polymerase [Hathewaya histolytica]|uniref:O-antigen polymerase n=1 Tax=Hathewaya histolytica TaxID=1498 RepID=UPI003B66FEC7